jgi:hypothetical protein
MESLIKNNQGAPSQPEEPVSAFKPLPEESHVHPIEPAQPTPTPDSKPFVNPAQVNRTFFDQQILEGLDKIPAPKHPGTLILTGDSQAIFTGKSPGELFLAACEYGNLT